MLETVMSILLILGTITAGGLIGLGAYYAYKLYKRIMRRHK